MTELASGDLSSFVTSLDTVEPGAPDHDLEPVMGIVSDARVWCFGEATHGAHEFLALRNRLFAYAVERLGFTAIALETHHGDVALVDDYVLGRRELTADVARAAFSANAAFRWIDEPFAENAELLRWIRGHNDRPTTRRPVRVYGIDAGWSSTAPPEWDGGAEVAAALGFIASVHPGGEAGLRARFAPFLDRFNSEDLSGLNSVERTAVSETLGDLVATFDRHGAAWIERASAVEVRRARRHAEVARLLDPVEVAARPPGEPAGERDRVMADAVERILEDEGPEGRVFVFAGEFHVHRAAWTYADASWRGYRSMVERLDAAVGDEMVVLGSAFDHGVHAGVDAARVERPPADESSVAGTLGRVGPSSFVLDLRTPDALGEDLGMLTRTMPMRSASGSDEPRLCATDSFDALVYVDAISPVRPASEWGLS